ncbi:MAG: hypothetical protein JNK66_09230 [Chitinophagales bacterium]|nr:hypothetical protein [Chitinophagales bacterium]
MIEKGLKLIIAALLLLCLLHLPYGYYQFVRFVATGGFVFFAFKSYDRSETNLVWVYSVLAILFQPIFKIALGRDIWNLVDVVVALLLIGSIFIHKPNKEK